MSSMPEQDEQDPDEALCFASKTKRCLNGIIDLVLSNVLAVALQTGMASGRADWLLDPPNAAFWHCALLLGYYFAFEAIFSQTPAKWMTVTKVMTEYGNRPTIGRVLIRSMVRFIPFDAFTFLNRSCNGWHDRWSRTCVIDLVQQERR